MGRKFLLALSLFAVSFLVHDVKAQGGYVNRTILGCTLGISTPEQVKNIVQKRGGKILGTTVPSPYKKAYAVKGLEYAGFKTSHSIFHFHRGRLAMITLSFDNLGPGVILEGKLMKVSEAVEQKLVKKYGDLEVISSDTTSKDVSFEPDTKETTTTISKSASDLHTILYFSVVTKVYGYVILRDIGIVVYADRPSMRDVRVDDDI